jgi:non-specific protein-tyrosine kinase
MSLSLVTQTAPRSPAAEAYQSLRTNIEFSGLDNSLRSLLVTCPDAETKKSDALANLAVVMADAGDRVIVVDGDLRRPQQHQIFQVNGDEGLTNWLRDGGDPALNATRIPQLRVLAAGPLPPNPVALLSYKRLAQLLSLLTKEADYVLVDAPPLLAVTDAALWASQVDGTLLAVTAGRTKREQAQRAKEVLQKVKSNILGAVLLDADNAMVVSGYGQ